MAAPKVRVEAILSKYLGYALSGEELRSYEPPEKCHERACSEFGRAVFWAAKHVADSETEIWLGKGIYPLATDEEEATFRRAVECLRDKKTGEFAGINEGDLRCLWYVARGHKKENRGRPTGEGSARNATRLALVCALRLHSGITVKAACGAVALGEDLFKQLQLPDGGMDSSSRLPHTARELLACTKDLRAVEGLARKAVEEARKLHEGGEYNFKDRFRIACGNLGHLAKKAAAPEEREFARTIRELWGKHRNTVTKEMKEMRISSSSAGT